MSATAPPSDARWAVERLLLGWLSEIDGSDPGQLAERFTQLGPELRALTPVEREAFREGAIAKLRAVGVTRPTRLVDAALGVNGKRPHQSAAPPAADPEPWPEPVAGDVLLTELSAWVSRYIHLPAHAADAIALWAAATWFVDRAYFAPILAILSATKQCGKSLLLDLLRAVVRRPQLTSGTGITAPVVFRMNEQRRPTFLIDEAEKLAGRHADRELVGMLNVGYRRGAKAQRCVESGGDYVVKDFDAFGYRACAAIGTLWDTLLDRAIVLRLERKPAGAEIERFSSRQVSAEGAEYARQLARWSADHLARFDTIEPTVPRPDWLSDRGCDNWGPLFAVATFAGGAWLARAQGAAKALRLAGDEADRGERLVQDTQRLFAERGEPQAIASGELAKGLNEIETSTWGDERGGSGISTHALAALWRRFGVSPRKDRTDSGEQIRGYWLADLLPVFARYPAPAGTVPTVPGPENVPVKSLETNDLGHLGHLGHSGRTDSPESVSGSVPELRL